MFHILFWSGLGAFVTWVLGSEYSQAAPVKPLQKATPTPIPTGASTPVYPVDRANPKLSDFISKILEPANAVASATGWFRDALITQAAEESGAADPSRSNISQLAAKYNNLFGFKADSNWVAQGKPYVVLPTQEQDKNGKATTVNQPFRIYSSWEESLNDLVRLLSTQPRYNGVRAAASNKDASAYFQALQSGGYATDTKYAQKLAEVFNATQPYLVA